MNQSIENTSAVVQYLDNDDQLGAYFASVAGGSVGTYQGNYRKFSVQVHNGRNNIAADDIDTRGFSLCRHVSKVSDYYNDADITRIYEDELKTLVRAQTGAHRVEVFDHTRRAATEALRKQKNLREVASVIHNDYTAMSGPKRLREMLPDEAEILLQKRFAIINVWRSINGDIENHPLALCDASSVEAEDLVSVQRKSVERIGEIQLALHNPSHRWIYFPGMTEEEVLLFKTYDSAIDGRARFTIHTSFDDPNASATAQPRESMETRCFVFFN